MFQRSLLHALLTLLNTQANFSFRASLLFKKVSCPLSRRQLAHCQAARVILWKKKKKGGQTSPHSSKVSPVWRTRSAIHPAATNIRFSQQSRVHSVSRRNKKLLDPLQRWQITAQHCLSKSPSLVALQKQRPRGLKLMRTLSDASDAGCIAFPPLTRKHFSYLRSNFGN